MLQIVVLKLIEIISMWPGMKIGLEQMYRQISNTITKVKFFSSCLAVVIA